MYQGYQLLIKLIHFKFDTERVNVEEQMMGNS